MVGALREATGGSEYFGKKWVFVWTSRAPGGLCNACTGIEVVLRDQWNVALE